MSNMYTDWEVRYKLKGLAREQKNFFKCKTKAEEFVEAIQDHDEYKGHSFWVVTTAMEGGMVLCKTELRISC
ncbi:MAG: hypothetical protein ACRC68_05860 [Clostridium sp.]